MNEENFVERRDPDWKRLMVLCDRGDGGIGQLSSPEFRELIRLYRRVSSDLALARTRSNNVPLIDFLNDLVGRAYGLIYKAPRKPILSVLGDAVMLSARTIRKSIVFIAVSAGLLFGSGIVVGVISQQRPDVRELMISPQMAPMFDQWKTGQHPERDSGDSTMMTGFYASNNPRVAIIAGAIGAGTFGIGSLFLILQNGTIVGLLGGEMFRAGKLGFLLTSLAPHGVPELSGMIVSGAAGLLLGWALIAPGRLSRGASLRRVGRDVTVLLVTSVVLMFIAAPIEGFFSFNPSIPAFVKISFAAVSAVAWAIFWSRYGRDEAATEPVAQR